MAGYSPLNLQFRPMSYEEMIAPIIAADTEHKALEEHYGQLDTMASVWEHRLAGEAEDSATRKLFTNYIEGLRDSAGQLGKEGLTHGSRRALMQMKSRFAGEITPIEEAYTLRQTLAEERRQAKLQDPTLIGGEDIAGMSLDEFLLNPTKAYNSISGAHITNMVATAAQQLTKTMLEHPEGWETILHGQQFQRLLQRGFRPEEVMQAIRDYGSPEGNAMLEQIVREAIQLSGVEQWGNEAQIQEAIDYALRGLYHAIGEDQFERAPDASYRALEEEEKDKRQGDKTHSYFNIGKHHSRFKSIRNKLYAPDYADFNDDAWTDAKDNPLKDYERNQKIQQAIYNAEGKDSKGRVKTSWGTAGQGGSVALSKAMSQKGIRESTKKKKETKQRVADLKSQMTKNPLTEKEYNYLINEVGVTPEDDVWTFTQKMIDFENKQSARYTGWDLNLTKNKPVYDDIKAAVNRHKKPVVVIPLKDDFSVKSTKGKGLNFANFIAQIPAAENITSIEFIPQAGGIVLFADGNKKFLIKPEALSDQMNFIEKDTQEILEYIEEGDFVNAEITSRNTITKILALTTHFRNQIQGDTSSKR